MKYLGMELSALQERGAINTAKEISQQPELWQKIWGEVRTQRSELINFFDAAVENSSRIILTGAGTSAFIGLSLSGLYQRKTGLHAQAVATTDLVSHPLDYL